jgi:Protein of unknown function (DUF433)
MPVSAALAGKLWHASFRTYRPGSANSGWQTSNPGTRLAVEFILDLLAAGQGESELLTEYPGPTRDDILACLSYASYLAHEYRANPIPA